jgi:asparagine synthase (glutamine-hydrolysing)
MAHNAVAQAMHFKTAGNLIAGMLVKWDHISITASLDVRCPLLDHRMVKLAIALAHRWKQHDGRDKYILLRTLGDRLPPERLTRGKMGSAFPPVEWFRSPLRVVLENHLQRRSFREWGAASPQFPQAMMAEHASGWRDDGAWPWLPLVLELWYRQVSEALPSGIHEVAFS